jgi:uracil-DNA glycosylase family 4
LPEPTSNDDLDQLHREIDRCTVCANIVTPFDKPVGLVRGTINDVVVIGQEPGRMELATRMAFAGTAGTRLNQWLRASGFPEDSPRSKAYFTSVLKCLCPQPQRFADMQRNCVGFLYSQLSIIQPRMIITLGEKAYEAIQFTGLTFSDAICRHFNSEQYFLFPEFGASHFTHVVWPHPSGRNHWLNDPENRSLLAASFDYIRAFMGDASE